MSVKFTQSYVANLKATGKAFWLTDDGQRNLRLFVGATGTKTWYFSYTKDGRKTSHKIGPAGVDMMTCEQAREKVRECLGKLSRGEELKEKKPVEAPEKKLLFGEFIEDEYAPWVIENRKSGKATVAMIKSTFSDFLDKPIEEITIEAIEKWRIKNSQKKDRKKDTEEDTKTETTTEAKKDLKASSINRQNTALKAALNWGVKHGIIEKNPMEHLEKRSEVDSIPIVRFLYPDERERLFNAFDARDERKRNERDKQNLLLAAEGKPLLPDLKDCVLVDHLKPMVFVSLYTGIRKGSLFRLIWNDIDFTKKDLMIRPVNEKTKKLIHIPMDEGLVSVLLAWKKQTGGDGKMLVFPSPKTGNVIDNCRKAWANLLRDANIINFRWHDMRHDFASQLVMSKVDLNTVRELMGHSSLTMILKYAHLAPKIKEDAIKLLPKLPIPVQYNGATI